MSQRYGHRRGRPPYHQYRMSPRGPPRDHYGYHSPPPPGSTAPPPEGVYANPHLAHSLTSLVGCVVEVKLTSGTVYEGVLKAVSPKLDVALEAAHDIAKPATRENVRKLSQLNFTDIVQVSAKEGANQRLGTPDIFKTDTEISQSNGAPVSRDLQPFEFEGGPSMEQLDGDSMGWSVDDMFQVNKEKFDVGSTYDEELIQYTTKLERPDTDDFREREARAHRMAQEISSKEKGRYDVDDAGTEEELFSAVVRQEVAPPPLETTPLHPNGGVPSIDKSEAMAPPPSTAIGVYSSPKTDASLTGSRNSESELLSNTQSTSSDIPVDPKDTPTSLTTSESTVVRDAEPAVKEVTEVKEVTGVDVSQQEETEGATKIEKTGRDESSTVVTEDKTSPVELKTATDDDQPPKKTEEELQDSSSETNLKVEAKENVRKFKLDPNAKEFTPASFSLPTTPTASPSPALSSSSSSARSSASTPYLGGGGGGGGGGGKKAPYRSRQIRPQHHTPTGSTFYQPEVATFIPSPSSVAQGGYVLQTQPFMRPSLHTPPSGGQVYYTPMPQYPGAPGLLAHQPGMISPQQLVAANQKFMTDLSAQPQVIGQQYPPTSQAHQFLHQPGQALLQPTASQPQLVPTPQVLVSAHQPMYNVVQGGLAAAGSGAAGAGGLVGGVPFAQYHQHHQQALAAAASAGQGVATQPLAGAPVAPSRQLFQHQTHTVGK